MQFGNLSGLINGTEQIVFDYEVTGSAVGSIATGSVLNGNEDEWYTIIILGKAAGTISGIFAKLNNDGAANYGYRGIYSQSTTVADTATTAETMGMFLCQPSSGNISFSVSKLHAKSGAVRLMKTVIADDISATTVTTLYNYGQVWSDTSNNLTNITFDCPSGTFIAVGTRVIILKSNNFSSGTPTGTVTTPYVKGSWIRVASSVLGSPASSITFSGLDGDRDVVYYLAGSAKASGGTINSSMIINSDSGTNYGRQNLDAATTSITAARVTGLAAIDGFYATSGNYCFLEEILFSKSGFVRPVIKSMAFDVSGTTVAGIESNGQVWNNTGSNITSLAISTANNFATGSQLDLYALRPGG